MVQILFVWFLQQCMQDLMDGYFPSELQERFPDGVPLEVRPHFFLFVREQMCKFVTNRNLLCRFMTDEMRNLLSGNRGINFLVKDGLFMEGEMTLQMLPFLRYLVCPATITLILTNQTCAGNHRS